MNGSEYLIVAVAVTAGAAVKGMTGLGLPLIAVPVITIFVGIEEAVLVMAFPTALSNAALVYEHRLAKKPENLMSFIICLLYTSPSPRDQRGSRLAACG